MLEVDQKDLVDDEYYDESPNPFYNPFSSQRMLNASERKQNVNLSVQSADISPMGETPKYNQSDHEITEDEADEAPRDNWDDAQ